VLLERALDRLALGTAASAGRAVFGLRSSERGAGVAVEASTMHLIVRRRRDPVKARRA